MCENLKNIKLSSTIGGEIVVDGNNVVGYYITETMENCVWLQHIEISKKYRGSNLGNQLFARAIRRGKITNLSVEIENEIAIRMFMNYGFQEYTRNAITLFMFLK